MLVAPCGPGGGSRVGQEGYQDDNCATREGIIIAGIEWLREQPPEAWTALSSLLIAIFTGTLWYSTDKLWRAGDRQIVTSRKIAAVQARQTRVSNREAQRAANAAERSARAAAAIQLPIIRIEPDNLGHGTETTIGDEQLETCYVHAVTVANVGAEKAFPKEILYGWTIGEKLPDEPSYQYLDRFPLNSILVPRSILTPDKQFDFSQRLSGCYVLKVDQWSEISSGNRLWFFCCLLYDDFMGESHSHGFCWIWSNTGMGMGWRDERHPAYNRRT